MGTDSRYGSIAGSTFAESSRFFHFEGVRDGEAAKRDMGKAHPDDDEGGEQEPGMEVVNGSRAQALYDARGSDCMICFNSSWSL